MMMIDEPDEHELFARYASTIPTARKLEIARQLLDTALGNGAGSFSDVLQYLNDPECELLVTMIGKKFPIDEDEFGEALQLFVLSCGKSAETALAFPHPQQP
jgi:hypothetical protein